MDNAKSTLVSTWTPLNHAPMNDKLFDERRNLIRKWYEKWNDTQRKKVLEDLVVLSKNNQLSHVQTLVEKKVPIEHHDFTRYLPRVISLYILSYLDPRSLCRCAQVSWYWKTLTEQDCLWVSKCLKFKWTLPFTPSPYETGVWKRFYLEKVQSLNYLQPQDPATIRQQYKDEFDSRAADDDFLSRTSLSSAGRSRWEPPPWRGSDPQPKDTWRYNVLDNGNTDSDKKRRRQKQSMLNTKPRSGSMDKNMNITSTTSYRVKKSQSRPSTDPRRPDWARPNLQDVDQIGNSRTTSSFLPQSAEGAKRPAPIIRPGSSLSAISTRSQNDPPKSAELFPEKPWKIKDTDSDNE